MMISRHYGCVANRKTFCGKLIDRSTVDVGPVIKKPFNRDLWLTCLQQAMTTLIVCCFFQSDQEVIMIPQQLVSENNHAVVDALHRSALLPLESIQRISQWVVGSGREMLSSEFARDPAALAGIPSTSIGMLGRRGLDGYRYCIEVSVDTYTKWLDLCEEYWHQAHQRMDTTLGHLQRYAPPQTTFAFVTAERAGDLAEMSADCVVDSSKAAAIEALDEINSTFPDQKKPIRKSRARSTANS